MADNIRYKALRSELTKNHLMVYDNTNPKKIREGLKLLDNCTPKKLTSRSPIHYQYKTGLTFIQKKQT